MRVFENAVRIRSKFIFSGLFSLIVIIWVAYAFFINDVKRKCERSGGRY